MDVHDQVTRRRTIGRLALVALIAAIVLIGWWASAEAPTVAAALVGAPGGPLREMASAEVAPGFGLGDAERALARAVAAAGLAADGDPSAIDTLDAAARDELGAAERLLARAGAPKSHGGPGRDSEPAWTATSERGSGAGNETGSAPGGSLDASRSPDPARALTSTPQGPILRLPGLWAKTRLIPTTAPRSWTIRNESGAGYAASFEAADVSSLRVDGGLIVPGRFYRISAGEALSVQADTPCTVVIRPLEAVPMVHAAPIHPAAGNG
ncbi:MAG: hypothetical protein H0V44_16125 [Planctomycetes bacterium]|nr:hypothetical protein [Planctomycetota bacterium]